MKFRHFISLLVLLSLCAISYAFEEEYVFVGKNGEEIAFTLNIMGDISKVHHIQICEDGEVYIKVEKIIAIPKADFSYVYDCNEQRSYVFENDIRECGSRVSDTRKWQCPYCNHWWELGERCQYEKCPTNLWDKDKEKGKDQK